MRKLLFGVGLLVLAGCGSPPPRVDKGQDLAQVRQELARTFFLKEKWSFPLGERVNRTWWLGSDLLVETANMEAKPKSPLNLHCFNGKDGIISWTFALSHRLDSPPAGNGSFLYLLVEGELLLLRRESGALVSKITLPFSPSGPAVVGEKHLWIGGWDKFLYTLDPRIARKEWRHLVKGDLTAPPLPADDHVVFGGEDGTWWILESDTGHAVSQEQLGGALRFSPVRSGNLLALAADDLNVYLREFPSGKPVAFFTLQQRPAAPPVLAGKHLLQLTEAGEMQIFAKDQGPLPRARFPGCAGYLMTGKKFYYLAGTGQELLRVDPETLKLVDTSRWNGMTLRAANPELGLLLAVSSAGTLLVAEE